MQNVTPIIFEPDEGAGVRALRAQLWLPQPPEHVFPFFADATNLADITPPHLHFRVVTPPPIDMRVGTRIDYRLRVRGLPVAWQSRITAWEPNRRFVDEQTRGPYRLWIHQHTFHPHDGGTIARDHVRYAVPGAWLEPAIHRLLVGPDLRRTFEFRQRRLLELFTR